MFHISNLGSFAGSLQRFADLDGYVPEEEDALEDFNYPFGWFDEEWLRQGGVEPGTEEAENVILEAWRDFVTEAVRETAESLEAINHWRKTDEL